MLDGYVDLISRAKVEGWLIDRATPDRKPTVAILVDGQEVGRCQADLPVGPASAADGAGANRCRFVFEFAPPLTIFRPHRIEVRDAATGAPLRNGTKTCPCPVHGRLPMLPILVSGRGEAGATLLMQEFAERRDVVVADVHPFDVRLGTYYVNAYKALLAHDFPDLSIDPDASAGASANGGNPLNSTGMHRLGSDAVAEIFEQDFPTALSSLFRDTIRRAYRAWAHIQCKPGARFLAEKSSIDADIRSGMRMLLGELREIVLIRDPRDLLCALKAAPHTTAQQALDSVADITGQWQKILAEQQADTLVVRLEDLIGDPLQTRRKIFRFIGLAEPPLADASVPSTGAPPTSEHPVGRWASELAAAEIAACNTRFAAFMTRFGYAEPASAGAAAAGAAVPIGGAAATASPAPEPSPVAAGTTPPPEPAGPAEPVGIIVHDLTAVDEVPKGSDGFAPGRDATVFAIRFGRDGDAKRHQSAGWAAGENGFTWTNAPRSQLHMPRPARPGTYRLHAHLTPFVATGRLSAQRLSITVNGILLGEASLAHASVLDCRIGWDVLSRADPVKLSFAMPDAARPTEVVAHPRDARLLGLSFQRLWLVGPLPGGTGGNVARPQAGPPRREPSLHAASAPAVSPAAVRPVATPPPVAPQAAAPAVAAATPASAPAASKLMLRFESLGENCEFGLVQQRSGVEPLGLLRFADVPLAVLQRALSARFAGLGQPGDLAIEAPPIAGEYIVSEKRFGFRYHAWAGVHERTADEVLARELRRQPFLLRKLLADLSEGTKIFVYHGTQPLAQAQAAALAQAIRVYGPGTLLWVELADAHNPPGSVRHLGEGLLKGHIDRFAPGGSVHDLSLASWIELCAAAHALAQKLAPQLSPV